MFELTGRVAVITGASSGIGVQFAKILAEQGADLVLLARRKEKLEEVAEEIKKIGRKCLTVKCDVTQTDQIKNAVKETMNEYGKVDILVNNAGTGGQTHAQDTSDEQWDTEIALNLTAVFKVSREFGKEMIKSKYGRVINIASMYGLVGSITGGIAYHASKGGVINFTRALAAHWAEYNITVNAIAPGFFTSELTSHLIETDEFKNIVKATCPAGCSGKEGELNPALIYLASDEATYTTGSIVVVDGGLTAI
ncbi:L-rhamnose 1-dehydrogenase (NADP(+)) [Candidatus Methanobinarius endosymbioticus]|uniref:L-rhamnose 1-dehydrogenase (NADP(+)) n=1 Tax=Candidatus Methanobinarius endosymbioticus TaxID=2006182 RepID=A0A366MDL5_9EURY|nr:L-rhamnose 1-dehydrogenase (NADP(+)) [Candidatus Methanobinarius endosymbioticus]